MFSARPEFLLPHAAYAKPQPTELGGSDCQLLQICPLWTHELMARAVCEPGPRGRAASGLREHGVSVTVARARACPAAPARAPATGRDFVMRPVQFVYSAEAEAQEFMSGVFSPILRRDDKVRSFDFRKGTGAKWLGIITRVLARLTADLNSGKSWNPIVCGTHRWRRKPASPRGLPRGAASPPPHSPPLKQRHPRPAAAALHAWDRRSLPRLRWEQAAAPELKPSSAWLLAWQLPTRPFGLTKSPGIPELREIDYLERQRKP